MLRKRIKKLLAFALYTAAIVVISTIIGLYVPVLLCDVWRLPLWICR